MIGDESALKALKVYRTELANLIYNLENNKVCYPADVKIDLLLTAKECLASARTEEAVKMGIMSSDIKPDYAYLEKTGWTRKDTVE